MCFRNKTGLVRSETQHVINMPPKTLTVPWNHGRMGRRFPDRGLLRYRKRVPQQLGDVIVVTNSPPIGHMRSQLTNHQVGIILDVHAWSEKLY